MQGISLASGSNSGLNPMVNLNKPASENKPGEEAKESGAQKAAESLNNNETTKAAPETTGKVNILA